MWPPRAAPPTPRAGGMAAFVTTIARLPRLKTRIDIPGNFWAGTVPADRNKLFAVEVMEVEESHVITTRHTGLGVRLLQMADLDSDETSTEAAPDLWIQAKVLARFEKEHEVCLMSTITLMITMLTTMCRDAQERTTKQAADALASQLLADAPDQVHPSNGGAGGRGLIEAQASADSRYNSAVKNMFVNTEIFELTDKCLK